MNTVWDIVYLRRPVLNYVSPPVCEVIFSGSSNPLIILSDTAVGRVTGLILSGEGAFRLSWNVFPGAICYNVYFIGGDNIAVPLAQCVTDPFFDLPPGIGPGEVIVTPITLDGEGPASDPVPVPGGGGAVSEVTIEAVCPQTSLATFPGVFRIERNNTTGNLQVNFTISGTATNGTDYNMISTSATIPNGSTFVFVDITPVEAVLNAEKNVVLTLDESPTYFVASPSSASILLKPALLKISNYGGAEPLFTPPVDAEVSSLCEWDGTWNSIFVGVQSIWSFRDANGVMTYVEQSIQGRRMFHALLAGPFNSPSPGTWQIEISCAQGPVTATVVWRGLKQGGDTASPAGVYLWNGEGSDSRAQITVEIIP